MLTQRALLLGAVALCFYLVAVVNTLQSYYYVLVWLAVGLLAASLGIALLSLTGTTCVLSESRASGYGRGGENEANEAPPLWEVALKNSGSLNKTGLVLEFLLEPEIKERGRGRKRRSGVLARFLIEALPAGQSLTAPLALDFLPRGVYSLQSARLVGSDVLGLFRASKRLALPSTQLQIIVAPAVVPITKLRNLTHGVSSRDGARRASLLGSGDNLRGVRTYVQGDDWRHVHWATTARTGELVVREFERSGRDSVLVVWDGAVVNAVGREGTSHVEEELSLLTSLLVAVDAAGTPVSLALLGAECDCVKANGQDGLLSQEAIALLARAQAGRTRPLDESLARTRLSDERFGQVFLVSSSLEKSLVDCVSDCIVRGEQPVVALLDTSRSSSSPRLLRPGRVGASPLSGVETQQKTLENTGARVVRVSWNEAERTVEVFEKGLLELTEAV